MLNLSAILETKGQTHKVSIADDTPNRRARRLQLAVFEDREHAESYQNCMGNYIRAYNQLKRGR